MTQKATLFILAGAIAVAIPSTALAAEKKPKTGQFKVTTYLNDRNGGTVKDKHLKSVNFNYKCTEPKQGKKKGMVHHGYGATDAKGVYVSPKFKAKTKCQIDAYSNQGYALDPKSKSSKKIKIKNKKTSKLNFVFRRSPEFGTPPTYQPTYAPTYSPSYAPTYAPGQ